MNKNVMKYKKPELDTYYDYVGIVDGLSFYERQKHGITTNLSGLLRAAQLPVKEEQVNNKQDLLCALKGFLEDAQNGKRFMIHFVAHGNESGIKVGSDIVEWSWLKPHFQKINSATNHTLLLNMSTCKGLYGANISDGSGEHPFLG